MLSGLFHWSSEDKGDLISIDNQSQLSYNGVDKIIENETCHIIRTTKAIPWTLTSFYFEVKINNCGENSGIVVGLTQADPKTRSGFFPGWSIHQTLGIGYHGDEGGLYHNSNEPIRSVEPFTTGDVVGCFLSRTRINDEDINLVQFTKNGEKLLSPRILEHAEWYPTIGMASPGACIIINFGDRPFSYSLKRK